MYVQKLMSIRLSPEVREAGREGGTRGMCPQSSKEGGAIPLQLLVCKFYMYRLYMCAYEF